MTGGAEIKSSGADQHSVPRVVHAEGPAAAAAVLVADTKQRRSDERLAGIDSIRFWLAIWVYLSHFGPTFHPNSTHRILVAGAGIANNLFNGAAAVIGFFIISGLCIHYPYRRAASVPGAQFYVRRYIRILVPLAVSIAISRLLRSDLMEFYESIIWSLIAELIYYSIYPLLHRLFRAVGLNRVIAVSFVAAGILIASHPHARNFHEFGPALTWVVGLPAWLLGCKLAETPVMERGTGRAEILLWRLAAWLLASVAAVLRFHGNIGYPLTLTLLAPMLYLWLRREITFHSGHGSNRLFEYFGQFSYSVYLTHGLAVTTLALLLPQARQLALAPLQLLFVLGFSYAFFLAVERPGHHLARKLARAIPANTGA